MVGKYWRIAMAAAFLAVAGLVFGLSTANRGELLPEDGGSLEKTMEADSLPTPGEGTGGIHETDMPVSSEPGAFNEPKMPSGTPKPDIYVYVCGEVMSPGVYALTEGSRIYEAVEAAGGFTDEAAEQSLNLAAMVSDGMQITVYSMKEAETLQESAAGKTGAAGSFVNLNTATKEELMTLKGIGEAKAEDILRYREKSGGFKRIEDIMKVPGIKDAGFQKIKDSITV